MEPEQSPFKCI